MCGLQRPVLATLGLAVCTCVSVIILIVGSLAADNWLSMMQLVPLFGAPIAVVVMNWASPNYDTDDERALSMMNLGGCVIGMIISSFIGLPLVLLHTAALPTISFWCWIGSTVVGLIGIALYTRLSATDEDV